MKTALRLGLAALATLTTLLALTAGLWLWSGSRGSLDSALAQAARLLPAGQTLETRAVSGSLRSGGQIGWLRWHSGGLSVEAREVQIQWDAAALLSGELRLTPLAIGHLRIEDARPPQPDSPPATPPQQLVLPLRVSAQVSVATAEWIGSQSQRLEQLAFEYTFDSYQHRLDKGYSLFLSNKYEFSGALQALPPMALTLQAGGLLHSNLPGSAGPLAVLAQAQLAGELAAADARLTLSATLTPQPGPPRLPRLPKTPAMQMQLSANIAPWQAQPLVAAQGRWQALNLAALWPNLPQTLLDGQAAVRPAGHSWQANITLANALPGPLDQQRLPLQSLSSALGYANGQWLLQSLQAKVAGGSIRGSGQYHLGADASRPASWQAQAAVHGINPAALDSRLAAVLVSGTLGSQQTPAGLGFSVNLQTAPGQPPAQGVVQTDGLENQPPPQPSPSGGGSKTNLPSPSEGGGKTDHRPVGKLHSAVAPSPAGGRLEWGLAVEPHHAPSRPSAAPLLRLQKLLAQGLWSGPHWRFDNLRLETQDASLQSQFSYNSASQAAQGHLSLSLPGLQASLDGLAARTEGQGQLTAQLSDAALLGRWLARWPGLRQVSATTALQGQASLSARWHGGWQANAQALHIDASLQAAQLDWDAAAASGANAALAGAAGAARTTTSAGAAKPTSAATSAGAAKPARTTTSAGAAKPANAATSAGAAKPASAATSAGAAKPARTTTSAGAAKPASAATSAGAAKPASAATSAGAAKPASAITSTSTPLRGRAVQLELTGTPGDFAIRSQGTVQADGLPYDWRLALRGGRLDTGDWQASISQLQLSMQRDPAQAAWRWQLEAGADASRPALALHWHAGPGRRSLSVTAGTARLQGPLPGSASLSWEAAQWTPAASQGQPGSAPAAAQWHSQGRVVNLPLAWLEAVSPTALTELGLQSDLLLAGQWEATQTDTLHAVATLERSSGDLRLLAETGAQHPLAANLSEARLQVNLDGGHLSGSLRWDSERAGKALLAVSTQLTPHLGGWQLPADAPLGGSLQMQLPPVNAWSALAPPGWRLRGTMEADITLAGTLAQPQWAGRLQARDLALRSAVDGIDFSHGSLLARLHGQQLDIQHFSLQGAGGTDPNSGQPNRVDVTGTLLWLTDKPDAAPAARLRMTLQAQIKALRVSARPDRRVVVSGQLTAQLDDARLSLRGALKADSALLTLPDDSTPQLGRDVVLRQPAPAASAPAPGAVKAARPAKPPKPVAAGSRISPDLQLELDLGSDFQVRGLGVVTRLAGKLTLTTQDLAAPRLSGVVRTVDGTYQAYGQRLQIERGLLRFTGAPDNPALTVLAIRPNLSQRVGVQIIGTALSPIVQLYADPDLPEAEKLGWLVLGRAPGSDGAETALMQQAALALLGGNGRSLSDSLAQALGLDELSLAAGSSTSSADGSTSAASITLGKRLSKDFYVSYENSLNGALGMIHVFYDLSRHLTLRAQTGEQSAIDLIYTLRYD